MRKIAPRTPADVSPCLGGTGHEDVSQRWLPPQQIGSPKWRARPACILGEGYGVCCLPLLQYQRDLGAGVTLCADGQGLPDSSPAQPRGGQHRAILWPPCSFSCPVGFDGGSGGTLIRCPHCLPHSPEAWDSPSAQPSPESGLDGSGSTGTARVTDGDSEAQRSAALPGLVLERAPDPHTTPWCGSSKQGGWGPVAQRVSRPGSPWALEMNFSRSKL